MSNPTTILLTAYAAHRLDHPHRAPMAAAIGNILDGKTPTLGDIEGIIQGFAMQPTLCTEDLQDVIDWVNVRFGTTYNINGTTS